MNLITSFYFDVDTIRILELTTVLKNNLKNLFINKIHLFIKEQDYDIFLKSEFASDVNFHKIVFILKEAQPTYSDLFNYSITLDFENCCICNSDIEIIIKDSINTILFKKLENSKLIYFLTRHEQDGTRPLIDFFSGSHDAFIFNSQVLRNSVRSNDLDSINYVQNTPGIESILTMLFKDSLGFTIKNPCFQLKLIHHHESNIRSYIKNNTKSVGYTWPVPLGWSGVHCPHMIWPQYFNLKEGSLMPKTLFDVLSAADLPFPKGILQVGASYGQEFQSFLESGIVAGVLIEPLPDPFSHISELCKRNKGFIAVNALCSDTPGEKNTFHVASNGGQSSSIMKPQKHLEMFDFVKFETSVELYSTTVDDVISFLDKNGHAAVTQQLDTLYMDVQGAEFKVLLGSSRTLRQINYIFAELIRGDLYEGAVSLANYCALLDAQGFTLNYLNFNKYHHADMLFVRKKILSL